MRKGLGFHNRHSAGGFQPISLFTGGVQGAWYDPSDFGASGTGGVGTLFQDSAGTTPVTAVEQPVGLMLDKRSTPYSVFFDGAGDYLSLTSGIPVPATGTFTIEAWIYAASATDRVIYTQYSAGAAGRSSFRVVTNKLVFANSSATTVTSTASISLNTWTHVVVTRDSSNNLKLFIDGNLDTTSASYTASIQQIAATIGAYSDGTDAFSGYISNLRITNTAVYTGNFTPPTAPLSPISGTSLLTCGTTWSGNPAITRNGDARGAGLNPFTASPVGNHAFQSTSASRPTLRARYNLLTYSEQFDNAAWTNLNVTVTPNTAVAPDGATTADTLTENTANTEHSLFQAVTTVSGVNYTSSVYLKQNTRRYAVLSFATGATANVRYSAVVDLQTGTITQNNTLNSPTGTSSSISSVGNGWYRVTVSQNATFTTSYIIVALSNTGTPTVFGGGNLDPVYTGDGTSGIFLWGAQLTQTAVFPSNVYQRIGAATDYATGAAFPPYLFFDGTDDSMQVTWGIDTPNFGVAGLQTQNTAVFKTFVGIDRASGDTNQVADFYWQETTPTRTPAVSVPKIADNITGTFVAISPTQLTNPTNYVNTYTFAPGATNTLVLRINGVQVATASTTDAVEGPGPILRIGAGQYNGIVTDYYLGNIYSVILLNRAATAGEISSTESWVAAKTPLGTI